ncbi:MAG: hypothetical protein KIB40_02660 [Pantoea sp.]|uniref:phage tail assembly protein T n=1 Tax=Pantoea sp. TaxID=69393 RepID=UPI00257EA2F0|nr:hypothetical protein [Pantoea sp.]MBS6032047.1 hypothetical protein [Pantoea sp.]
MMRTEWGVGVVASTIANVNRDAKTPPFSPTDFTLHFTKVTAANEPISLEEAMSSWA